MNRRHVIYRDSAPEDAPILWRRGSEQYRRLRVPEYAFVAHRFPYVDDAMDAYKFLMTKEEVQVIYEVLAEAYNLPKRDSGEPRVSLAWLKRGRRCWAYSGRLHIALRAAAPKSLVKLQRAGHTNVASVSSGWCQLHVVLHEFAHLIAGYDDRPGWKGNSCTVAYERFNYRSGTWGYVPGRFIRSTTAHGPSFVLALADVFNTTRGLTDAF